MTMHPRTRLALRIAVGVVLVTIIGLLLAGGPSGTSKAAHAGIVPDFCPGFLKDDDAPDPAGFQSGVESLLPSMTPAGRINVGGSGGVDAYGAKNKITAYENFGSAGLRWTRYDEDCSVWGPAQNMIANQFFGFSTALTSITIGMYTWATDPNLLDSFMKPVECVVKGCGGSQGLDDALYLNFLTPVIVLGALWAGYTGLVRRSTTQAWQGGLWMIMSAGFALFFMANPTGIASTANSVVSNGNAITASAVTSATSSATAEDDVCYLPDTSTDYGPRVSSCSIWKALAFSAWSTGQFGVADAVPLKDEKVGKKCYFSGKAWTDQRVTQLCATAWTHDEAPNSAILGADGLVGEVIQERVEESGAGGMTAKDKQDIWNKIKDQQGEDSTWAGKDPGARINIAFAAIIANMAAGLIILLISFSNVVLALGMILLTMAAPVFLLIGAHPGVGRGIALKWLELLLSTVVKRLILGFMLALLIGMYQIIISTDMASLSKVALIMAVGVAAMIYRKPMMEALNVVNLGGTQTGIEQGGQQAVQNAGSTVTGAASGGMTAAFAGGGVGAVLGAAGSGAVKGRTGMNPAVQAARMAGHAGSRRGAASAAARATRQREERMTDCNTCGDRFDPVESGSQTLCVRCEKRVIREAEYQARRTGTVGGGRRRLRTEASGQSGGGQTPRPDGRVPADRVDGQQWVAGRPGTSTPRPTPAGPDVAGGLPTQPGSPPVGDVPTRPRTDGLPSRPLQ